LCPWISRNVWPLSMSNGSNPKRQKLDQTLSHVKQELASCYERHSNTAIGFSTPKHKLTFLSGPKAQTINTKMGPRGPRHCFGQTLFSSAISFGAICKCV
jgi:hypothetical protein